MLRAAPPSSLLNNTSSGALPSCRSTCLTPTLCLLHPACSLHPGAELSLPWTRHSSLKREKNSQNCRPPCRRDRSLEFGYRLSRQSVQFNIQKPHKNKTSSVSQKTSQKSLGSSRPVFHFLATKAERSFLLLPPSQHASPTLLLEQMNPTAPKPLSLLQVPSPPAMGHWVTEGLPSTEHLGTASRPGTGSLTARIIPAHGQGQRREKQKSAF